MTTYVLTLNGDPKQTTESLDHAKLWKLKGNHYDYKEVIHYDSKDLEVFNVFDGIEIQSHSDTVEAYVEPEFYREDESIEVGRIFLLIDDNKVNLDKANLTDDLRLSVEREVERVREGKNDDRYDPEFEAYLMGHDRV